MFHLEPLNMAMFDVEPVCDAEMYATKKDVACVTANNDKDTVTV